MVIGVLLLLAGTGTGFVLPRLGCSQRVLGHVHPAPLSPPPTAFSSTGVSMNGAEEFATSLGVWIWTLAVAVAVVIGRSGTNGEV